MKWLIIILSGTLFFLGPRIATAQEANNPLLYSYQAVQLSDQHISHDPVTLVLPGVAYGSGFSSYLENPASAALFEDSFGSFGLAFRNVNESGSFLDNPIDHDDNQMGVSNLGFIYEFPTVRGSLVVGAGYSQHSFYNRAMSISGRNPNSTMTDFFKMPGSVYGDIAFQTYAIDVDSYPVGNGEDILWDESIFRIGFDQYGDYLGIRQEAEILERGHSGEYSGFLATEFLENLMVGISVGIQSGRHRYERIFMEIDELYDYAREAVETEEGLTDIDTILLTDEIRNDYVAFSSRIGAIYRVGNYLNIGASYTFPSRLNVNEEFDARISSTFDNGVVFEDDLLNEFSYSITSPARINLGAALTNLGGVSASFSAEYVDHGNTRIDFDSDLFEDQRDENQFISDTYGETWNLRGGVAYDLTQAMTLRAGYGIRPSRFRDIDMDIQQFSAGVGFLINPNTRLEVGAQYSMWDEDQSAVYEYGVYDYTVLPEQAPVSFSQAEFADRSVNRLQVLATLRFQFN